MASTGSNLEADIAGNIPEINPIIADKPVPRSIFPIPKKKSKSNALVNAMEIIQTNSNPMIPPITDKIILQQDKLVFCA